MKRSSERLIDLAALWSMLLFAWSMREDDPALSGVIVAAAVGFWFSKNATPQHASVEEAAAKAAAEVLATARQAKEEP